MLIALAGDAWPQEGFDASRCDAKLGANYDDQSAGEKSARMAEYYNCRMLQDIYYLQTKRKEIHREVAKWKSRAVRVTQSTLQVKRAQADAELKTRHAMESRELETEYASQYATVKSARTHENYQAINAQVNEITKALRSDRAALRQRQREERQQLKQDFTQSRAIVDTEIERLVTEDLACIDQQFLEKSERLTREYQTLDSVPDHMSLNDYEAQQAASPQDGATPESTTAAEAEPARQSDSALASDDQPVGSVQEMTGTACVTRTSGTVERLAVGSPIYQGDVVETDQEGAVGIAFDDESTVAVGEDARLAIDEYVYDPENEKETDKFSVLRAIFVFTSKLIGREDEITIDTPVGNLGFRG